MVWNCLDGLIYYTTSIYPPQTTYCEFIVGTYFYSWSFVTISYLYENHFKSFLFVRIFFNLFLYYHLLEFFFLSLYENKQPYEYRRLKQIFYRQNSIMIFNYFICTKLVFFTLSYFHLVCDYFFLKYSFFKCIKLSRNIYSFCCIRFFTIIWKNWIHFWF